MPYHDNFLNTYHSEKILILDVLGDLLFGIIFLGNWLLDCCGIIHCRILESILFMWTKARLYFLSFCSHMLTLDWSLWGLILCQYLAFTGLSRYIHISFSSSLLLAILVDKEKALLIISTLYHWAVVFHWVAQKKSGV